MEKVAIIGSGLIGRCWAMMFSRAGFTVVLYDIKKEQLDAASESIAQQLAGLEKANLLFGQSAAECLARVSTTLELGEALEGAIHCQECCPESVPMKKKVFEGLDDLADDKIVLASSSSCIAASEFSGDLKHKSQVIIAHPVNPPHYIPLVEIIPSPDTAPEVTERTSALMKKLGQAPVTLKKEVNGFILNRLQYALLMEAWRIVEDGICSPEDVDTAVKEGLGLRWSFMGPFETIDLNAPGGVSDYCERYGENITAVCAEQDKLGARAMKGANAAKEIHEAMRKDVPAESMEARRKWRDDRLAALYLHKQEMANKDKEAGLPWAK